MQVKNERKNVFAVGSANKFQKLLINGSSVNNDKISSLASLLMAAHIYNIDMMIVINHARCIISAIIAVLHLHFENRCI